MRLLIDTNVFLWTAFEPRKLSRLSRAALADSANQLVVSIITPLELGMQVNKGRLSLDDPLPEFYLRHLRSLEAIELPVERSHALRAAGLPYTNRDPMDRILAAQSAVEGIPIVTSDRRIAMLGVDVIW